MLALLTGCGGAGDPAEEVGRGSSSASCVAPYLDARPPGEDVGVPSPVVAPGDTLTVHGHFYTDVCNDAGQSDPRTPLPDVTLTVIFPGGETAHLGPFTPSGPDLGFRAAVRVPLSTAPGAATVSDDGHPSIYGFTVAAGPGR